MTKEELAQDDCVGCVPSNPEDLVMIDGGTLYQNYKKRFIAGYSAAESEIRELREKLEVAVEALESLIKYDTSPDYGDSKMAWDMCVNALEKLRSGK